MKRAVGKTVLLVSVLVVTGFAVAGLMGLVSPVVGTAVGLGAQILGTIAFFVSYLVSSQRE